MKYSEGNLHAAEHFMDCGVFMFYYRMKQKVAYIQWRNEQQKTT
jgi:hypothetical protein